MISGRRVSSVFEVVGAFLRSEGAEKLTDCGADGFDGPRCDLAQQVLELGEYLFDGVQVGRVFWQEEQLGGGCADELAHGSALVAAEIVHDHDVAGLQGRDEDLLDVGSKAVAVDWAIENPWSVDPVVAQRGQEGRGLPVAVRDLGREPHAAGCPAPQRRHVGLGPGLVDEDQALRLDPALILCPLRPPVGDVGTIAFDGDHAFF